jgi:F0F1-type ATP synthase membrane subunit b/b'
VKLLRSTVALILLGLGLVLLPAVARAEEPNQAGHAEVAGGAGHGASARESEEEAPGEINWFDFRNKEQPPFFAVVFNFALLAFLYYRFGKKPIGEALVKHRAHIVTEIEEAQRMKREAEKRAETYQAKLQDLEAELERTKLGLAEAGKGERERIVKEAEEKAARMQKDAAFMLEQEAKQVRLDLQREAVLSALEQAKEILKKRVTASDQERLAEEFLASLEPPANKGPFAQGGSPRAGGAT